LGEILLGRAGVRAEKLQDPAVHVRDLVRAVAQEPILERAILVHDDVHEFKNFVSLNFG
jgi:hypothetical protein